MIVGIDPGASGALAFLDHVAGTLDIVDMPTVEVKRGNKLKRELSAQMLTAIISSRKPASAIVERVGAMPGQGVSSMFQFGRNVGTIEGVLAALHIPITMIAPQIWRKLAQVREGKDGSRQRAGELFPAYAATFARVKDDGRADAAIIAWTGVAQ